MMDVPAPLKIFIDEERHAEDDCCCLEQGRMPSLTPLERGDRERHGQAARQKDNGVNNADNGIQLFCRDMKVSGVHLAVDRVDQEQPAEQQDLGEQEEPHPDLGAEVVAVVSFYGSRFGHCEVKKVRRKEGRRMEKCSACFLPSYVLTFILVELSIHIRS